MKKSLLYSLLLVSILVLAYFTVFQQQTNTIEKADTAFALKAVVSELIDVADDLVCWNVLEPQLEVVHVCCCAKDIAIGRLGVSMEKVQDSTCK